MTQIFTGVPEQVIYQQAQTIARQVGRQVVSSESIEVSSAQQLVVRDILPQQDFESGDDNGYTTGGDAEWRQDWSAGGASNDSWSESYEIDSTANADNKVIGFYGCQFPPNTDLVTRQLRFASGTGGNQGIRGWFETETMENDAEGTGLFSEFVIYGAQDNGSVEHWIEDALDDRRFRLLGVVGEPVGETISQASNPISSAGSQ